MPEVIPELVYVIGLFFAVVGYITARGLLASWTHSLGYVLAWLGSHLRISTHLPWGPKHIDVGGPFRALDSWAITALQNWCDGAEIQIAYCLHGMEKIARYTAEAIDFLARETDQTFDALIHIHLPKWAKAALGPALLPLLLPKLLRYIQAHIAHGTIKTIRTIEHTITHTVTRVVVKTGAVALPGALGIPKIWREIHGLTKRWARINARLRNVEALFGVAAMAAAMANVLGLPNWRCLTRGNVGRAARAFCGLDKWLVDFLLLGTVEGFAAADLCGFEGALIKSAQVIEPELAKLVTVEDVFINCPSASYPRPFSLPAVSLPALVDDVALAA